MTTHPTDLSRLNELYARSEDPWHTRSGWYSERKQDLVLASLPNARYGSAFEPGSGTGELTEALAKRCDQLLAVDDRRDAVTATRNRTAHLSNVEVGYCALPEDWPSGQAFDLVVLHEIGYRFGAAAWAGIASQVRDCLSQDATVLACHRQQAFEGRVLQTETVHGLLDSILGLPRQTKIRDADFTIDVWTTRPRSSADVRGIG
jgi:SAM-dependent methyltransferase